MQEEKRLSKQQLCKDLGNSHARRRKGLHLANGLGRIEMLRARGSAVENTVACIQTLLVGEQVVEALTRSNITAIIDPSVCLNNRY